MPRIPGMLQIGQVGQYGPQDLQAALRNGPQVANETARTVTASTQPFTSAAQAHADEMAENYRQKRQLAFQQRALVAQSIMGGLGMVNDVAFGAIGAVQQGAKVAQEGSFLQGLAEKMRIRKMRISRIKTTAKVAPGAADSAGDFSESADLATQ